MKIFFLLFFVSSGLLTGCGTNYNYSSTGITVYNIDGTHEIYDLLSVRGDTAIVVMPRWESDIKPISFSHAEVIKQGSILRIERNGHSVGTGTLLGAVSGIAIGAIWGALTPKEKSGDGTTYISVGGWDLILMSLGAIGGSFTGALASEIIPTKRQLSFLSPQDREFLRSISLYPDKEPPEMQYVR